MFRVEKLELRRSSSQAKALGTLVAITGAFVMTLYKGPAIGFNVSPDSPHQILLSDQSNWVLGGLIIAMACLFSAIWNVFQAATVKEYPDETTVVFLFFCFGTIQCTVFSVLIVRDPGAWVLEPGIEMIAVVFSGIIGGVFRINSITWCLRKKGPVFVALFKPIQMVIAAIAGIIFLGDTLHLGSVIGGSTIAVGFYTVMWGLAKEKEMVVDIVSGMEPSTQHTPLLHKTNT